MTNPKYLEASRRWKRENRERNRAITAAWKKANPERVKEHNKTARDKLDPVKKRQYSKKWRDNNPEKAAELGREWRRNNPERAKEIVMRRNARKAGVAIGEVNYEDILERDGLWCYLCQSEVMPDDVHFDHVTPLAKGGAHSMNNIKVTHSHCNMRKGANIVEAGAYA